MLDVSKRRLFSRKKVDESALRLPWLKGTQEFIDGCTRCQKCIEACETQIIKNGDGGFPTVDFSKNECTFCYQCAEACPEALFLPQDAAPWSAKANITDACLAKNNVECRSCGDMCDTMAIKFQLRVGSSALPKIELDDCTGCGACVAPCPTNAIQVSNV
ncbi:ferredoxin-type protein NapF [Vibrio maerlii]|uniref:ferredoxin-type protein NapF n=1 Tax=Vibrio maerlii TaxID=2231648 RepID=UPI000E3C7A5B|nr:ferredoxin-type protein NapF [Vibrio maerlii]